jgi:hypothetical protein
MYRLSDEDSDSSLTIYYKAYNNNKPEMNESSSESTERTQRIEEEIARMKEVRKRKEKKKRQRTAKRQRPRYPDIKPIIKGYDSDSDDEIALPLHIRPPEALVNCPQHVLLDTQHLLYENPLPLVTTQTIEVLHDTGASISMLPAQFTFAWSNVRPCLHGISGCFKGGGTRQ